MSQSQPTEAVAKHVAPAPRRLSRGRLALGVAGATFPRRVTSITSVPLRWHCCALFTLSRVAIVPIEMNVPPLRIKTSRFDWGCHEDDASVLCGNWLCGGPLDFPAAASSGPSHSFPVSGPFVERFSSRLGRAPRCATISSARAHCLFALKYYYQGLPASSPFLPSLHTIS